MHDTERLCRNTKIGSPLLNTLKQIAAEILENIDEGDRVELAPCAGDHHATYRCFPAQAEFWTIYVCGMALEDFVSTEAAIAVIGAIWDERELTIDFDFGSDGYSCSSIAKALHELRLLEGGAPTVPSASTEVIEGLAPLREVLTEASSNHGRMQIAGRHEKRADVLCVPDRTHPTDITKIDTRITTLSDEGDSLVAAWLPETPQRVLIAIKSWGEGVSRILRVPEARGLADAIEGRKHLRLPGSDALFELSATCTNRGEPYRDGMEVQIGNHSIFLEEGYHCDELTKLLRSK